MSYAIVFRAFPDVDHMAPLAWQLLQEGEQVHAILSPGLDPRSDDRLRFLSGFPGFHVHPVDRASRRTLAWALALLGRHRIRAVAVEWGYGYDAGYERLRSPAGARAVLSSVAGSVRHRRDPAQTRANVMVAARLLGRAVACLPHGLSVKLDDAPTRRVQEQLASAPYDWRDRNRFDTYVLNTARHRSWHLRCGMGDPDRLEVLGSLRWSPEWMAINRRITTPYAWPPAPDGALRVAFMVPKWGNRVDGDAVLDLVARLQGRRHVSLVIKGHPRKAAGGIDALRADPRLDWTRIHDATGADSVAIIAAADVIIDVGSSIGLEALMQGRVLLNPTYLHELTTYFDTVAGSCVVADGPEAVEAYLAAHVAGAPHEVDPTAREELVGHLVYGSAPAPYDVPAAYASRLRQLASSPRPRSPERLIA